jgi:porin
MLPMAIALALPSLATTADASDVFTPKLAYTGEAAATLDGGKRSGTAYAGQLMFGADVDLDAAFGWRGATI